MSRLPGFKVPQAWGGIVRGPYHLRMDGDTLYVCYGSEEVVATLQAREYRERFREMMAVDPRLTSGMCLRMVLNRVTTKHERQRWKSKEAFVNLIEGGGVHEDVLGEDR